MIPNCEMDWLSGLWTHLLECFTLQPDKPNYVGLTECYCTLAMYESASVPLFLEEIMLRSGVAVSLRD